MQRAHPSTQAKSMAKKSNETPPLTPLRVHVCMNVAHRLPTNVVQRSRIKHTGKTMAMRQSNLGQLFVGYELCKSIYVIYYILYIVYHVSCIIYYIYIYILYMIYHMLHSIYHISCIIYYTLYIIYYILYIVYYILYFIYYILYIIP